jgi:carboxymethylenebutenolidase
MPNYDLVAVWEEHLRSEFVARDVDAPTDTMVPDACVNHVPTMTGGVGRDELKRFYKYHFVKATPPDIEIIPVSRTVGTDTIVDEMVAKFKRPDK